MAMVMMVTNANGNDDDDDDDDGDGIGACVFLTKVLAIIFIILTSTLPLLAASLTCSLASYSLRS